MAVFLLHINPMTMKYISLFSVLFITLFSSCDNDPTINGIDDLASVDVTFKAMYGGENFLIDDVYEYNGDQIRISNLKFFVSELTLGSDTNGSEIDEIKFVDFNLLTNSILAEEGLAIAGSSGIPVGDYPGINVGVGVVSDLNAETPDQFASTHPLSNTSMYWEDWNSYIFLKLEGTMDTDGDGMFDDVSFVYHVGSDPAYEQVNINNSVSLTKDQSMGLVMELDVEKLFVRDGQYLDIEANPRIHNIDQMETGHYLMDNYVNALTIQ